MQDMIGEKRRPSKRASFLLLVTFESEDVSSELSMQETSLENMN